MSQDTMQQEEPRFCEQRWISPVVCHVCAKVIPANTDYFRVVFQMDGPDKQGRDCCVACSKSGVPNE